MLTVVSNCPPGRSKSATRGCAVYSGVELHTWNLRRTNLAPAAAQALYTRVLKRLSPLASAALNLGLGGGLAILRGLASAEVVRLGGGCARKDDVSSIRKFHRL